MRDNPGFTPARPRLPDTAASSATAAVEQEDLMVEMTMRAYARYLAVYLISGPLTVTALPARAQSFVAPPRTIADVTAILDQEKPDPKLLSNLRADADASPPIGTLRSTLASFYFNRGEARANLGRVREAIADGEKAIEVAEGFVEPRQFGQLRQFLGIQYANAGDLKKALENFKQQEREIAHVETKGRLFNTYYWIVRLLISLGDLKQAEVYAEKAEAHWQWARTTPAYALYRLSPPRMVIGAPASIGMMKAGA
jgi:hypothetical protein